MNKIIIPVLASILILGALGLSQEADAVTITISDEASCLAIPGAFFGGSICILNNDFTVGPGDTLVVENTNLLTRAIFTNFGTIELIGDDRINGRLITNPDGEIINECDGVINAHGSSSFQSGSVVLLAPTPLTNKGTINLFGGTAQFSGILGIFDSLATVNNHGTINENPGPFPFFDTGIVVNFGTFNDNLPDLCLIPVEIDIKPGSDPNSINCKSKGNVPIAILSDEGFDATTTSSTLPFRLNDSVVTSEVHNKIHLEDTDDDGDLDAVIHIDIAAICDALGEVERDDIVTLVIDGQTIDGTSFQGSDNVIIKGKKILEN